MHMRTFLVPLCQSIGSLPCCDRPLHSSQHALSGTHQESSAPLFQPRLLLGAGLPVDRRSLCRNFPIMGELLKDGLTQYELRPPNVVYIGGLTPLRGARQMVQAMAALPEDLAAKLLIVGELWPDGLDQELRRLATEERMELTGSLPRGRVGDVLGQARIGLVLFQPAPNHVESQPNKLFEYMSAGIPVVASDFPLWREIVDGSGCGVLVDPTDSNAIADGIQYLLGNPARRRPWEAEA
jgi:glycosyltransferase involved in cell wall biosynthesis